MLKAFKWCMIYRQSEKGNDYTRLTALTQVSDKYSYEDISFPVSY